MILNGEYIFNPLVSAMATSPIIYLINIRTNNDTDTTFKTKSFLFSNLLIYSSVSKKAAVVNIPENTGQIYQSLGKVEKIATVYEELGISSFASEVENLLNSTS